MKTKVLLTLVFVAIVVMPATSNAIDPTAVATTTNVTTGGGTLYSFTVRYADDGEVNVSTLDSRDVRVTGPGGFSVAAAFVAVNVNTNGTPRIATYSIVPPGASWDFVDSGTYNVVMQANQVQDGIGNPVAAGNIGSFTVAAPTQVSLLLSDFNRDGFTDYLLFNPSTRRTAIWYLRGNTFSSGSYGPILPAGWNVVALADFDQNSTPDYVLFNASTRQTAVWFLNNATYVSGSFGPTLPVGWKLVAARDVNGDGKPDYVLMNPTTRQTAVWFLNGTAFANGALAPTLPAGWTLVDARDFSSNNKPDYLLFKPSTRQTAVWYLNETTFVAGAIAPTLPTGWTLEGASDFNANGSPDLVLVEPSTRRTAIWYLNGTTFAGSVFGPTLPSAF